MKLTTARIVAAMVLGTGLMAGIAAVAQTMHRARFQEGGFFGGTGIQFLVHRLDLTDAQKTQIKQIMAKEKPTMQPLIQQLSSSRQQHRQLVETAPFDESQAQTLATEQAQTIAQLMVERARVESEIYQVLTADQKTKLNQMLDQRDQRRAQHRPPSAGTQQ
jgi:periplasmic protein CpxP/Spy